MSVHVNTIRLLGAAQLFVFAASMISDQLLKSVVQSGITAEILVDISQNIPRMRLSNLIALINSLGIIVLGVLFYTVLNEQNQTVALIAMGCYFAEAISLAVSKVGGFGLLTVSKEFAAMGSQEPSYYKMLGDFLYKGIDRRGYDIHMLFFCVGGILFYYLLHASKILPAFISIWGLVAICLLTIPVIIALLDQESLPIMVLGLPYAPFELVLGLWLVVKGFH